MKSITSFFRRKGHGARQVEGLLLNLQPLSEHDDLQDDDSGTLEEIVRRLKQSPELSELVNQRNSLEEAGYPPIKESRHTLKLPLPRAATGDAAYLCVTRLSAEKWVCYHDPTHSCPGPKRSDRAP